MEAFMAWLKSVNDVVWGPGMLVLLVGTGLYLTVGLKFFTFRNFFRGLKNLWAGRSNQSEQGEISPFNALMTALAADIGTGNIVGVAAAILGGGLGNILDRVFRGYVVDMIATDFISFPVFNVADCFITCGVIGLLIHLALFNRSFWREEKKTENHHDADL